MTTETQPRMSVAEIALMRAIVHWRKAHGVEFEYWLATYTKDGVTVTWDYSHGAEIGMARKSGASIRWIPVRTVTEAVDLLVAFGYLPARFASSYRDGWEAALTWVQGDPRSPQFLARFHDPANIGFPAHEVAW